MDIPLFRDGKWTVCQHPMADDDNPDYEDSMRKAGYARTTEFHPGGDERAITITVWGNGMDPSRPAQRATTGSPKYLLDIWFYPASTAETVAVAGIVDLMNLLATWTPVVQVAYVCDEAADRWRQDNR